MRRAQAWRRFARGSNPLPPGCGRKLTLQPVPGLIIRFRATAVCAAGRTMASRVASTIRRPAARRRRDREGAARRRRTRRAVAASMAAAEQATQRRDQAREALDRDLEAARYAGDRAFRQYDAADPANRLVAGELEARASEPGARSRRRSREQNQCACSRIADAGHRRGCASPTSATNLKTVWSAPTRTRD